MDDPGCNIFGHWPVNKAETQRRKRKMKNLIKPVSLIMTAVLLFGTAGCRTGKVDIKELQKNRGIMLEIQGYPQEAMLEEDYKALCSAMVQTVYYDGTAYNANPLNNPGLKMTDEDYLKIYDFCMDNLKNNKFGNYSEDVCDGDTYRFTYYDVDGNPTVIYDGYCYDNKDLQDIMNTIGMYSLD